jgi:hypothetical protein
LIVLSGITEVVLYQRKDVNTRRWIDKHFFGINIYSKDYPFKSLREIEYNWYARGCHGKLSDLFEKNRREDIENCNEYYKSLRPTI